MDNDTPVQNNQTLTAPVWFYYPQTGGFINFSRKLLKGTLTVANNNLSVVSDDGAQIINNSLTNIRSVKRFAPAMTFNFNDGSKFQIDFRNPKQTRAVIFGPLGSLFAFGKKFDQGLVNMKPFEEYFTNSGLIH